MSGIVDNEGDKPAAQATPKPPKRTRLLSRVVQVVIFITILAGVLIVVDARNGSLRRLVVGSSESLIGSSADAKALVRANSAFAFDLYQQVRKPEENLFFSPYSLSAALAMVYAGARGETQQQMADVLHLPLSQQGPHPAFAQLQTGLSRIQDAGDITIRVANSLWAQEGCTFLRDYLSLIETHYGSSITLLDYRDSQRACERINKWVEQRTAGKISDVIAPGGLGELPALTLVNAIYFKGNWQVQFSRSSTEEMTFRVTPLKSISTPMMMGAQETGYAETESFQILELAYVGRGLSMLILLPREAYGLERLEADLSMESLTEWRSHMRSTVVDVFLPRFKMTRSVPLDQTLQAMGMIDVFRRLSADLTGMTGKADLYVSAVIHKAYVEVNEEGTEAAAATAVRTSVKSRGLLPRRERPVFYADHPFVFIIQENSTGSILFMGRVMDPTKS